MKCQVLAGKCLQQQQKETHIPFILLSFIPTEVLSFFLYKVYPLPLFTSRWQLETFSYVRMCVCVYICVCKMFCNKEALRHASRDAGRG